MVIGHFGVLVLEVAVGSCGKVEGGVAVLAADTAGAANLSGEVLNFVAVLATLLTDLTSASVGSRPGRLANANLK
ncbi:hypothetical protein [Bradyrhizobium neotropicale]|uniref:Uncharacterized protein n=1 Tax=Bradyrhizobium neotropicale TaxID=1497615 RepID=A0A176ZH51_9BRAD|nr:hypothetical protein [Bradyrhizobium neotropicale]OAF19827.1 hypothetical protein AXW67_35175 [Bradyrhizobium neotropicale]